MPGHRGPAPEALGVVERLGRRDARDHRADRAPDRAPRAEQAEDVAEHERHERDAHPQQHEDDRRREVVLLGVGAREAGVDAGAERQRRRRGRARRRRRAGAGTAAARAAPAAAASTTAPRARGTRRRARSPPRPRTAPWGSAGRRGRRGRARRRVRGAALGCSLRTTTAPPRRGRRPFRILLAADYLHFAVEVPDALGFGGWAGFGAKVSFAPNLCFLFLQPTDETRAFLPFLSDSVLLRSTSAA